MEHTGTAFPPQDKCPGRAAIEYNNLWRRLWEDHIAWTRMAEMNLVFGTPDTEATVARLLRNPTDMAAALLPFYGPAKAAEYERLFHDHLTIAAKLVQAAKAGNQAAVAAAEAEWYANAFAIARFMASINPFWSESEWRSMMNDHLIMVEQEAVFLLIGDYAASVAVYDPMEDLAMMMADVTAQGVIRQFPDRFPPCRP